MPVHGSKRRATATILSAVMGLGLAAWLLGDEPPDSAADKPNPVNLLPPKFQASGNWASQLPTPSRMSVPEFEQLLFAFLQQRKYDHSQWGRDKALRDTGPYLNGEYYGTHPAVRVYYSPEVIEWLEGGRKGPLPDGAMIVKEQYPPPAARHHGKTEKELWDSLESWTVMVKDSEGSHDGWFWSNPGKDQAVVDNHKDFSHPISGFGHYCLRCHASTESPGAEPTSPANEYTFAALRNIEGYPGEPILFRVDDSWRDNAKSKHTEKAAVEEIIANAETMSINVEAKSGGAHPQCTKSGTVSLCTASANTEFVNFFGNIKPVGLDDVCKLPPVTHDWAVKQRDPCQEFVSSNQCMSCHAGLMKPYGPTMFVPTGESTSYGAKGWNISPFGEWRWTPMGLAGRDPIFHAQLESERKLLAKEFGDSPETALRLQNVLQDTCLKCHGAMGRHQFHCDQKHSDQTPKCDTFSQKMCQEIADDGQHIGHGDSKYGALAREGISCMVCHRMQQRPQPEDDKRPYLQFFLETSVTGNLYYGPKNEVYGPFKDDEIAQYPMQHALGITPKHSSFLQSSQMCGSCHTVTLPAVDAPIDAEHHDELNDSQAVKEFANFHHHVEQATYLEWLNSAFENEFNTQNPQAKSCQDCHMSKGLVDEENGIQLDSLATRMAIIQDTTYPDAENLASHKKLDVRVREKGYSRHNFSGLNLFLLELFEQFDDVLGVRTDDYMTGSDQDIELARQEFIRTAREKTADLELATNWSANDGLEAVVTVTNKAGHRFPTGVGFRRAFLELLVIEKPTTSDDKERIVWSSGRTNSLGVIIDENGQPLKTEFFEPNSDKTAAYQAHHTEITSPDQVQIYESLLCNSKNSFTTSFIHGCTTRKDNRLLPRGWTANGPDPALSGRYLEATYPVGLAVSDSQYQNGSGSDTVTYRVTLPADVEPSRLQVRASLYYQAIPPYFLRNLFRTAPEGEATQRLYFLLSHANFKGTAIENWKLLIDTKTAEVGQSLRK